MLINDTSRDDTIDINLTIEEMSGLGEWIYNNIGSWVKMDIMRNGCDLIDYYNVHIITIDYMETSAKELKDKILAHIRSGPQESNFGGIRENEYWLPD